MKFIRSLKSETGDRPCVFGLERREKVALLAILNMYPVMEPSYHRLSQQPKPSEQQWLEETMKQLQEEHKKKLQQILGDDSRFFKQGKDGLHFTLNGEQMEWLLRVLNDIRVGSWVRLGRPEMDAARHVAAKNGQTHFLAAMDLSGYFQSVLLQAFG